MPGVLRRIEPVHPPLIPPPGSRAAGVTPNGQQLYELTRRRSRGVPDHDPETGDRKWRRSLTGDKLYPLNRPEIYEEKVLFYLESEGNNNVQMVPYVPPTPEQIAEAERQRKIAEMQSKLAEMVVDAGITPDDLLRSMRSEATGERAGDASLPANPANETELVQYPVHEGYGRWTLSDGSAFKGKKAEAESAEAAVSAALVDAKAAVASAPSF